MKKQNVMTNVALATLLVFSMRANDCAALSNDTKSPPAGPRGAISQKKDEAKSGKTVAPGTDPAAVDMAGLKSLSWVIDKVASKKIIYVGEYHDRFSNHTVELQVIKGLFKKNPTIAIGMEMFQRPFQQVLDDYIGGVIGEEEFLKKSEYFTRWGYDFNLYKPIIDFARAEKIPVIALNARREIADKVAKAGRDSLSLEEKKEIPQQLDLSDDSYRERLKQVFEEHKNPDEKNFDFFYEAQVLWDETMAQSLDEYMRKDPLRQMIVLAGSGHIAYGSGIPKRAFRRNGCEYATILNDADVDRGVGDYLIYPEAREGETAPKLMAILKEEGGKVMVRDFPEDSVSRKAGMRVGDVLLALDNAPVQSVADVRIMLFYKHHGEATRVKVMRKRFLLGERELELDVMLQ
ncbi:MAG TPA: ChaN family lipoprotein [Nitrospirota bacterium]|nr:ChaN family lipoprotein [Nitrospirota bacterium]